MVDGILAQILVNSTGAPSKQTQSNQACLLSRWHLVRDPQVSGLIVEVWDVCVRW